MSFNFNVADMKNELAKGVTMDELAKAMSDALNEAQKQYNAEEAKRKEAEAQKERESKLAKARMEVMDAFCRYMKLAMPAELRDFCDDEDWEDLNTLLNEGFAELESYFKAVIPWLTSSSNKNTIIYRDKADVSTSNVLEDFLKANGLK